MLKMNSKKAKENLKKYLVDIYEEENPISEKIRGNYSEIIKREVDLWFSEQYCDFEKRMANRVGYQERFFYWVRGFGGCLQFDYFNFGIAHDLLQEMLEETNEEANKWNNEQAEKAFENFVWVHAISKEFYKKLQQYN